MFIDKDTLDNVSNVSITSIILGQCLETLEQPP